MLAHLMDVSLRSLVLAVAAATAVWRVRSAAIRHAVWSAVAIGMLALFAFGAALPKLPVVVAEIATTRRDAAFMQSAWLNAVQDGLKKVGLELRTQKALVDVIVVDRLEKNPTAN